MRMNDRVVYAVVEKATGAIAHVWESAVPPSGEETDEVPLLIGVPVDPADPSGPHHPSPDHVCVRILDLPDVPDSSEHSPARHIRENFKLDGSPLDVSESTESRLPGLPPMSRAKENSVRSKIAKRGLVIDEKVSTDPAVAARKLRFVGVLKQKA